MDPSRLRRTVAEAEVPTASAVGGHSGAQPIPRCIYPFVCPWSVLLCGLVCDGTVTATAEDAIGFSTFALPTSCNPFGAPHTTGGREERGWKEERRKDQCRAFGDIYQEENAWQASIRLSIGDEDE